MAIDQTYVFGTTGATQEHHVGNTATPGQASGTNPRGPADAPVIPPNVVTGTTVNKTVGSTHLVNPA